MKKDKKHKLLYNLLLMILNFSYVFILGMFPSGKVLGLFYAFVITILFILTVFAIKGKSHFYTYFVIITISALWISEIKDFDLLTDISGIITILFFITAIVNLIRRIAGSSHVGALEFLEATNIYFLIGIIGSVLFRIVYSIDPASFTGKAEGTMRYFDFIYYSFVTLTTLGYGDISPVHPLARSFAILVSITGQLYLTMIVAVLVGKYIGGKTQG